ncbi:hypothetical protein D9619_004656 [Psilocybe cf. subviscida]|uniref:Uncharacterized protein n=1 Tax=Psilocybe cf. subviscida TaxID=2480587 RepID=A0A8H5BQC3_9AGAR|nr:hypothetical protein D9619_004656 [Psilocybe cf. subviscida]
MPPPPIKLGQFKFSLFGGNKAQKEGLPYTPDSHVQADLDRGEYGHGPERDDSLPHKKAAWAQGMSFLDQTKEMLEQSAHMIGKESTKRFKKEAAKLTKNAPAKSKLPKRPQHDVDAFQQSAKALYTEVENAISEGTHIKAHAEHLPTPPPPAAPARSHEPERRPSTRRSDSPPPLPRKPPSPKVTFNAGEMKPETVPNSQMPRRESTRNRYGEADLTRSESVKPRYYEPRNGDVSRSTSKRDPEYERSKREYDKYDKYRDDPRRSDSRRYPSDSYRDKDRAYKSSREYNSKDYYSDGRRRYDDRDRDRERYRDSDRDRERSRRDSDRDGRRGATSRGMDTPLRVVHEDTPLSPAQGGVNAVPAAPTYVPYPEDRERKRSDRDKERDKYRSDDRDRERDRDRNRDATRDRDRDRRRDDYNRSYSKRDDEYYKSRGYDGYDKYGKPTRRYEDEYRSSRDKDRYRDKDREREKERERDKYRERDHDKDKGKERDRDRDRDRERERANQDRDKDRERRHYSREETAPPMDPALDPSSSKFQELFSPEAHHNGAILPPPSEMGHAFGSQHGHHDEEEHEPNHGHSEHGHEHDHNG